jgi:integrase
VSVRKRTWRSATGEAKAAWIVDYTDGAGKRRQKTCARKKEADAFAAKASVEVHEGVHTADSASITIAEAADLWLASCSGLEGSTRAQYRQHKDHIVPLIGGTKLSRLTVPTIRAFEDRLRQDHSAAMVRKVLISLNAIVGDAQERGLVMRNVVRDLRSRRKRGKEKQAERRQQGHLRVYSLPTRALETHPSNSNLLRLACERAQGVGLGQRRPRTARIAYCAKGRSLQPNRQAEVL